MPPNGTESHYKYATKLKLLFHLSVIETNAINIYVC